MATLSNQSQINDPPPESPDTSGGTPGRDGKGQLSGAATKSKSDRDQEDDAGSPVGLGTSQLSTYDLQQHEKSHQAKTGAKERGYANIELGWNAHQIVNDTNVRMWQRGVAPAPLVKNPAENPVACPPEKYEEVSSPQINDQAVEASLGPWLESNDKKNYMLLAPPEVAGLITATVKQTDGRWVMRLASNGAFLAHSWQKQAVCCGGSGSDLRLVSMGPEDISCPQMVRYRVQPQGGGWFSSASLVDIRSDFDRYNSTVIAVPKAMSTIMIPDADSVQTCFSFNKKERCKACVTNRIAIHKTQSATTEPIQEARPGVGAPAVSTASSSYRGPVTLMLAARGSNVPCLIVHPCPYQPDSDTISFRYPLSGLEAFSLFLAHRMLYVDRE